MIGGILFFIAEFKLDMSLEDNVVQLFLEMLSMSVFFGDVHLVGIQPLPKRT